MPIGLWYSGRNVPVVDNTKQGSRHVEVSVLQRLHEAGFSRDDALQFWRQVQPFLLLVKEQPHLLHEYRRLLHAGGDGRNHAAELGFELTPAEFRGNGRFLLDFVESALGADMI
jgi:hypothetical protein